MLRNEASSLHDALASKDDSLALALIQKGVDIETKDKYGRTPLHLAAQYRHLSVVEQLIKHHVLVDAQDKDGRTALYFAVGNGQEGIVKLLVNNGANVELKNNDGGTPLHAAAKYDQQAIAIFLIQRGASVNANDNHQKTPIQLATDNGHTEMAALLSRYAVINLPEAVTSGNYSEVEQLLGRGADIEMKDKNGRTSLHIAAQQGSLPLVTLLTQHQASIEAQDSDGRTPLYFAAGCGHEEIVKLLIAKRANVNVTNISGRTPLHSAASNGQKGTIELLVRSGANIKAQDLKQQTPIQLAEQQNNREIVSYLTQHLFLNAIKRGNSSEVAALLQQGAVLEEKDENQLTPLALACQAGHEHIVALLIERGANKQTKNSEGRTPLHLAALFGHENVVKCLLEADVDLSIMDNSNQTALDLARQKNQRIVAQYLAAKTPEIRVPTVLQPPTPFSPTKASADSLPTVVNSSPRLFPSTIGTIVSPRSVIKQPSPKPIPFRSPKPSPAAVPIVLKPSPRIFQPALVTPPSQVPAIQVQCYPLAALIALQQETFRTSLVALFNAYVSSQNSTQRLAWEKQARDVFNTYVATESIADCHYMRLMSMLFHKTFAPPLQGTLTALINQTKSALLTEAWPVAIDGEFLQWEQTISLFTQCSGETLEQLEQVRQKIENEMAEQTVQRIMPDTTPTQLAHAFNHELSARSLYSGLMENEHRIIYYMDKSEKKLKTDLTILARLLPFARCDSQLVQGKLIGIGLRALERNAERQWIICYWLRDVMRLAISTHVRQFDHEMLHKLLVRLLEKCPSKEEKITSDIIFFGNNGDRTYILAFFEAICAIIEAAQLSGMTTLYTNIKERFESILDYMDGRAKKIKNDPLICTDLRRLKRLEKLFKNDKTTTEKLQQLVSPLCGIIMGPFQIGVSVATLVVAHGADVSSYISIMTALIQMGGAMWQMAQMVPSPAWFNKWHTQYRAAQEIIHHAMSTNEPWVWYETQLLLKQSCERYKKSAVKQIMSLLVAISVQQPDLWPYFRPIIEAFKAQFIKDKKILIHAVTVQVLLDQLTTPSLSGVRQGLQNEESLWQLILPQLNVKYSMKKEHPLKADATHYIHAIFIYRDYLSLIQRGFAENSRRDEVMELLVAKEEQGEKEKVSSVPEKEATSPLTYIEDFFDSIKQEKRMPRHK